MNVKKPFRTVVCLLLFVPLALPLSAQSDNDLYIFGFSQTIFSHKNIRDHVFPNEDNRIPFVLDIERNTNSFALHQVNLFFNKPIDSRTTFFLNIEATGSYSTESQSGTFEIPEGWISHSISDELNIKVGLMLPTFNNLNEINNRLPLFPYLVRPVIYERLFDNLFVKEDYVPQQAYLQISGFTPVLKNYQLHYALQVGNSESSYHSKLDTGRGLDTDESSALYRGENLTEFLAVSGRVGISNMLETVKFGISGSYDHDNKREPRNESIARLPVGVLLPAFGDIPRYRIGMDFSFSTDKWAFESEAIRVMHNHRQIHETPQFRSVNLNKFFAYANLTYSYSDRLFTYVGWDHIHDHSYEFLLEDSPDEKGVNIPKTGLGYRTSFNAVLKAQWTSIRIDRNPHLKIYTSLFTAGISVIF